MNIVVKIDRAPSGVYYRGLSDKDCNDPLDPPYCPLPFHPRNYPDRDSIPEVRKLENGDRVVLTEAWEWFWYNLLVERNPSVPEEEIKNAWRSAMRGNAAFTNKAGSDTNRSFVLGTNTDKEPMKAEGVDCPGGNLYRAAGDPVMRNGRLCVPVWCLDWSFPPPPSAPAWLVHTARIVHNDFRVTDFDYRFPVPLITTVGEQEIVDGYHCRMNYMRASRLVLI